MAIFKIDKQNLLPIKEQKVNLESKLQTLTEENLEAIFGLKFVSSEFHLQNFRIDTLAFDEEAKAFVIIEYKKDRSFSVIDQGFAYLSLMLNNKADFILEYNEKTKNNLERQGVDWTQSRVIFLANSFTAYQQNAINFRDLPIELWEVRKFANNSIFYNQLKSPQATESIKTISKNKIIENVSRQVKKYSVQDHFKKNWEVSRELFESLREQILNIDSRISENPNPQDYIGYKIGKSNLCAIHTCKSKLKLDLARVDKEDLKDPENKVKKVPWEEYKWPKMCNYEVKNINDIPYAMFLIKQVYNKFYK